MPPQQSILYDMLHRVGLQQYTKQLTDHGFDSIDLLQGITEADMATLDIELGHRRRLQRLIGNINTRSYEQATIAVPVCPPQISPQPRRNPRETTGYPYQKRHYRRRPVKNPNAPERATTGFILYTKFLRQDPDIACLPFVSIAKLIGERWSSLSHDERNVWNSKAAEEKKANNTKLAENTSSLVSEQESQKKSGAEQSNLKDDPDDEGRLRNVGYVSRLPVSRASVHTSGT